jgi:hypothetical protein
MGILFGQIILPQPTTREEEVERVGTTLFVSMPSDTLSWLQRPSMGKTSIRGKGGPKVKLVAPETGKKPVDHATLARNMNAFFWYRPCFKIPHVFQRRAISLLWRE